MEYIKIETGQKNKEDGTEIKTKKKKDGGWMVEVETNMFSLI